MGPLRTDIVNISTRKCHGKVSESAFSVTTMHRLRKNSAELGFFVIGMLQCMGESFSATFIRIAHWETVKKIDHSLNHVNINLRFFGLS